MQHTISPDGRVRKMIRFGTGGWRGVIAEDFTFENVRRVAKGMALYARSNQRREPKPITSHDMRRLRLCRNFRQCWPRTVSGLV